MPEAALKSQHARVGVWFYLLAAYIVLQFAWWAYLLVTLNSELADLRLNSGYLQPESFTAELRKRHLMILGEGTVFLGLLFVGFYLIRRAVLREFSLVRQQRNFLLSVTHELKTPIASARLYLQTLQKRQLDEPRREKVVRQAIDDTSRLQSLVDNILLAAQLDNKNLTMHAQPIELKQWLERYTSAFFEGLGSGHVWTLTGKPVVAQCDEIALESIVLNLLENAVKYTPPGTRIEVGVRPAGEWALLWIEDHGPGVPSADRERIFERFFRRGNEDSRQTRGTGLGLYLVRSLCEAQKGKARCVAAHTGTGARFEVMLPLA